MIIRILLIHTCLMPLLCLAQSNLEYSQTLLISNSMQTVPTGKTWKVTAVFGRELRVNECVNMSPSSTHEIGKFLLCGFSSAPSSISSRFTYAIRKMVINSTDVVVQVSGYKACNQSLWGSTDCTSTSNTCSWWGASDFSCANMATDPNLLPMWLPEGATVQSGGPNTFVGVGI
jgi:hypothetical protein